MTIINALPAVEQVVVVYSAREHEPAHERGCHAEIARRLAELQGYAFGGDYNAAAEYRGGAYYVPSATLVGVDTAVRLGITSEYDLFGGVVPYGFIATKAISHPLLRPDLAAPQGWSFEFGERTQGAVLNGISVFTPADARQAGMQLLTQGPVRIKPTRAAGGRGQVTVDDLAGLDATLAGMEPAELHAYGLVLETHLDDVKTLSVGQVRLPGLLATYCGHQSLTLDNAGQSVYGGSTLMVVRGDFDVLLAQDLPSSARLAIKQAQVYDAAASACFEGFFASRRNYDVAQGHDAHNRFCSGVLEQSWRIGGASGAEVVALETLHANPEVNVVHVSCTEAYGQVCPMPVQADLMFRGFDDDVGFITKYVVAEAGGNANRIR